MSEITPSFQGEMQLAGWSETHTGGCKVTFWLSDPADLDAFRTLTVRKGNQAGHRFMAVLVEIGEDEQPVQQQPAAAQESEPEKLKGGPLAKLAGQWCSSPDFWEWLRFRGVRCDNEEDATRVVRNTCGVTSRAELDHYEEAASVFKQRIRGPFMDWQAGRR
jgi:hypothetical protein